MYLLPPISTTRFSLSRLLFIFISIFILANTVLTFQQILLGYVSRSTSPYPPSLSISTTLHLLQCVCLNI